MDVVNPSLQAPAVHLPVINDNSLMAVACIYLHRRHVPIHDLLLELVLLFLWSCTAHVPCKAHMSLIIPSVVCPVMGATFFLARNGLGEAHVDLVDDSSALSVVVSLFSNAAPARADCGTSA